MENLKIKDIMTQEVVSARPDDPVIYTAKLLIENNHNGLPVVDAENTLIGIITEYDMISQSNSIHLPTLINILGNIGFYKKDKKLIEDDLNNLLSLKVKDIMNTDPLYIDENAWIQEVADLFAHHHRVNPIPVIDENRKLVGIVSRFDLIRLFADEKAKNTETFIKNFENRYTPESKKRVNMWPFNSPKK